MNRKLIGAGFLVSILVSALTVYSQQQATLEKIQFVGLKKLTAAQVIELSELKLGQPVDATVLDAAAAKLIQTGLFRRLSYRVHNASGRATVTFEIEESAISMPVVLQDFVWFSDEEILAAIRAELPYFNGTVPATGEGAEKIAAALQRLLTSKHITGRVEFLPNVTKEKQELVFSVKGARVPVCAIGFPGAKAIPESELIKTSQSLLKIDYSKKDITAFVNNTLVPLYRRLGYLRIEFQPLSFALSSSAQCAGGVDVTIPVEEGLSYRWAKSVWDGNDKLTVGDLAGALGMNPGDLADGIKIDNGVKNVSKAYSNRGYLSATVKESIEYDDASSTVTYRFNISEGPRYFMGNLIVSGLSNEEAEQLKSKWTLGNNAVFDQSYLDSFKQTSLRDFLRNLRQRSGSASRSDVEIEVQPNAAKQSVDVVITFKR